MFLTTSAVFRCCEAFRNGYFDVCRCPYVYICCRLHGVTALTPVFAVVFMAPLAFADVLAFAIGWPRLVSVGCCALVRSKPKTPLGKRTGRRASSAARLGMYGVSAISLLSLAREITDIRARSARGIVGARESGARGMRGRPVARAPRVPPDGNVPALAMR